MFIDFDKDVQEPVQEPIQESVQEQEQEELFILDESELPAILEESGLIPDMAGIMDVIMEADSKWYALQSTMHKFEFDCFVNEDVAVLNEGIKEYYVKLEQIINKMWAAFRTLIEKVSAAIAANQRMADLFVKKHEAALNAVTDESLKGKVVSRYVIDKATSQKILAGASGAVRKVVATGNTDPNTFSVEAYKRLAISGLGLQGSPEEFNSTVIKSMIGENPQNEKITAQMVKESLDHIKNGNRSILSMIAQVRSEIDREMSTAVRDAKAAANGQESEKAQYNKQIESARNRAKVLQMIMGGATTAANKVMSDSMKVCRAALTGRAAKVSESAPVEQPKEEKQEPVEQIEESASEKSILDDYL